MRVRECASVRECGELESVGCPMGAGLSEWVSIKMRGSVRVRVS